LGIHGSQHMQVLHMLFFCFTAKGLSTTENI